MLNNLAARQLHYLMFPNPTRTVSALPGQHTNHCPAVNNILHNCTPTTVLTVV